MSIREIVQPATVDATKRHRMTRVVIDADNQIYAIWSVRLPNGAHAERSVPVSSAVNANITGRAAFQNVLDTIRDDTFPRAGAKG